MDTRAMVVSFGLVGIVGVGGAAAGQHEGHQLGGAPAPSAAQVAECRQAQPVITGLLNAALKRLEDARLTNSAVAMRDATDDVQAALVDVRAQLAPCAEIQIAAAGHVMPGGQQRPNNTAQTPAAAPTGTPAAAMPPGHVMPGGQQMPTTPQTPAAAAPRPPAAAMPPGHVMPGGQQMPNTAQAPAAAPPRTPSAAAMPRGHAMPPAASPGSTPPTRATARSATAAAPPTSIAELKCTNAVDQKTAPRMLYQGRTYYFCTDASRAEFAKDPAKFVAAN